MIIGRGRLPLYKNHLLQLGTIGGAAHRGSQFLEQCVFNKQNCLWKQPLQSSVNSSSEMRIFRLQSWAHFSGSKSHWIQVNLLLSRHSLHCAVTYIDRMHGELLQQVSLKTSVLKLFTATTHFVSYSSCIALQNALWLPGCAPEGRQTGPVTYWAMTNLWTTTYSLRTAAVSNSIYSGF